MSLSYTNVDATVQFFEYGVNVRTRTIFMGPHADEETAGSFLKAMHMLSFSDEPINVIMNCAGGDEYHGLAMYDAIATSKSHVTITVYGHTMSMGSWVLQAADARIMAPNATMLLHYGKWGHEDHVKYYRTHAKELERLNTLMEDAYLEKMPEGFRRSKLKKMLEDESYITAKGAVALGLADKVLEIP